MELLGKSCCFPSPERFSPVSIAHVYCTSNSSQCGEPFIHRSATGSDDEDDILLAQTLQTALGPSKPRGLRPQTPPYEGP